MKVVRFHPAAEVEMIEAAAYYEAQQPDLGRRLKTAFRLLFRYGGSLLAMCVFAAVLVGCAKAPDRSGDAAVTRAWRPYGTGGELYTDMQAEAFRDLLNRIGLPTTPEKACATLGIDISRLEEPIGPINGRVMLESTRLSMGYYIHFGTPIWPTNVVADGGRVTAVRILATNSTESIYVPNLDDEVL